MLRQDRSRRPRPRFSGGCAGANGLTRVQTVALPICKSRRRLPPGSSPPGGSSMFSQPVTGLTEDSGLPNLPYALDGRRMLGLFDQAACLRLEHVLGLSCTAEVLSHKLGQRCTIRYTLTRPGEGRPIHVATIIAKLYGKPELAKRLYGRTQDLCRGP